MRPAIEATRGVPRATASIFKEVPMSRSVELITDSTSAIREIGLDFTENTLQSGIYLEGPRDRDPVLAKFPDGTFALLVRNVEYGNYLPHGRAFETIRQRRVSVHNYDYYFTMPDLGRKATVAKNDARALADAYAVDTVVAHPDMPLGRFRRFQEAFTVRMAPEETPARAVHVYAVDRDRVADAFCRFDANDAAIALAVLRKLSHATARDLAILAKYMEAERIDPFTILDGMVDSDTCVLADTRLTAHTFTALPWNEIEAGDYALYVEGALYLLSEKRSSKPFPAFQKTFPSLAEAVAALAPGKKIGVEGKSIPVGVATAFGLDALTDITDTLTLWRNRYSYQALPYCIINSHANAWAMEKALDAASKALAAGTGMTERDVERVFVSSLGAFAKEFACAHLAIEKYFVVLHAGTRCPFPALSSDYALHPAMKTLKLDAGVAVYRNGMRMSASDLCRTLTLTEEGAWLYALLGKTMREDVIKNIKAGMSGEEVFHLGIRPLEKAEDAIKRKGLLDASFFLARDYNRNIGHTIDKEESAAIVAQKGDSRRFESLMVGCIEFQWPYKDHAPGIEDMFFITPEGTVNITY